jgi:hypothetical protein
MRYVVESWLGTGVVAQLDGKWECWGRRRARKLAEAVVAAHKQRGPKNFEVVILGWGRGASPRWYFSTEGEGQGLRLLDESEDLAIGS